MSSNNLHYGTLSTIEVERNGKDRESVIYFPVTAPDTGNRKEISIEMLFHFYASPVRLV